MARIKYSTEEVDLLARLIKSEALGEGEQGMLLVGNVVINRVVANCDVFRNTRTITEVVYQKNAFSGVGTPLFNEPVNELLRQIVLTAIEMNRQLMPYGLKIPVPMSLAQKNSMAIYPVALNNTVFITQA